MTTGGIPSVYRRLASAVGADHWQRAVVRQEAAIRANWFLGDYLRAEYAIAYQLDRLRDLAARLGAVPAEVCNDPSIFPAMGFAAQVLEVMARSTAKQARSFAKRIRAAFGSAENMHGLRLELQAATHFARRGHSVSWHRANRGGTFDLLVEDLGFSGLEVECKFISDNKGRRIHRHDALKFWGSLWKDVAGAAQSLRSGLAVVLTVPYHLPDDAMERAGLARQVVARILAGSGASLGGGADLRIGNFDLARINAAMSAGPAEFRRALDAVTGTTNREAALYGTPRGGMLVLVMQSAVEDDVMDQVIATLADSAPRQFTGTRGALFWVALQGIGADQLLSLHGQDNDPVQQPTALRHGVSRFLADAPGHVVGVVFGSRSGLLPTVDGSTDSGGATYFFLKEESPQWHPSFRDPLTTMGQVG